ncbi:ribonuclease BN (tRNA processing enzyme) [Kitasatospora gansuensis]|uniref:Ribonuclease BN (tRNA processing enzyme) n=1 Tax=Kitasatospora gansuensis TaxID=258050 RepID=A0A7W7SEP3_9ACTN|nr:MBL fold metallo-hydrolase [Kitasatospora gansuensis]MBB4949085.1 ribonuclease BN (tRNA processing enzyme) [Kitasatospora gansuensis]
MKLTVVGCSGSFPSAESPCSSYLIEADGYRVVLDLGNGALGALQKYCGLYDIDAVLLSHLHADHCIDLCAYWVARNYRLEGCPEPVPVYGPAGTADRLARAYDMPEQPGMTEVFDFRTLTEGSFRLGPLTVTTVRVSHPVETFAFRIEHGGRSLVYSGDTGECAALVELARGADLFLCEAAYTHGKETFTAVHLNGREAGEHAAAAGVGRLVLTHIPPWTDPEVNRRDAAAVYAGPVELARPGATYELR